MKPGLDVKLLPWNLNSSTTMVMTGMATFHQVIAALNLLNRRMAMKFRAVKMAIRRIVMMKPVVVTLPLVGL
jgi:hypothetical protein